MFRGSAAPTNRYSKREASEALTEDRTRRFGMRKIATLLKMFLLMGHELATTQELFPKSFFCFYFEHFINKGDVLPKFGPEPFLCGFPIDVPFLRLLTDALPNSLMILNLKKNPCTQQDGYRRAILDGLPDLKQLDGKQIEEMERVKNESNLLSESESDSEEESEAEEAVGADGEEVRSNAESDDAEKEGGSVCHACLFAGCYPCDKTDSWNAS